MPSKTIDTHDQGISGAGGGEKTKCPIPKNTKKCPVPKKTKQAACVYNYSARWTPKDTEDYTDEQFEEEFLSEFRATIASHCDKYIFQLERGESSGRLHMQCWLHKKEKARPNAFGAILGSNGCPGIEISASSTAGIEALRRYAMKSETRVAGPWADTEMYLGEDLIKVLDPWQSAIQKTILMKPDSRKIYWFYDKIGGSGKSAFAKYMDFHHGVCSLTFGDAKDLLHIVSEWKNKPAYFFDLSRSKGKTVCMGEIYQALESIKNGHFSSCKYQSSRVIMKIPHVICFSNYLPDFTALSMDRLQIIDMEKAGFTARRRKRTKCPSPDSSNSSRNINTGDLTPQDLFSSIAPEEFTPIDAFVNVEAKEADDMEEGDFRSKKKKKKVQPSNLEAHSHWEPPEEKPVSADYKALARKKKSKKRKITEDVEIEMSDLSVTS